MQSRSLTALARLLLLAAPITLGSACADSLTDPLDPESGSYEGVEFDEENPGADVGPGKSDVITYAVPDIFALSSPEVIVSLDGLTVHVFDREAGFSAVYPAGVGILGGDGESITPTGHFRTSDDVDDRWWYIPRRYQPAYFGGFPFLRIDATNSKQQYTYGLHGPITEELIRDYVSHGCVRMDDENLIEMYYLIKDTPSIPVTIQTETELDANGEVVDVGVEAALFAPGELLPFGPSVGPRPELEPEPEPTPEPTDPFEPSGPTDPSPSTPL